MTPEEIQSEMVRISKIMEVKYDQRPSVCQLKGDRPNIEISNDGVMSYEAYERGVQLFHHTFTDLDELMYHIFSQIVPPVASTYASEMEAKGHDYFKSLTSKRIELMSKVNTKWAARMVAGNNG